MTCCGIWIVMGGLLAAGAAPVETAPVAKGNSAANGNPAASQELGKLQGSWRAVKFTVDGQAVDPNRSSKKGGGVSLELHGDHYEFKGMGIDFKGQVRIDPTTKPKRIEFVRAGGPKSVSSYELDGSALKLTGVNESPQEGEAEKPPEEWLFKRERP